MDANRKLDKIYDWLSGFDGKDGFIDRYTKDMEELKSSNKFIKNNMVNKKECSIHRKNKEDDNKYSTGIKVTIGIAATSIAVSIISFIKGLFI